MAAQNRQNFLHSVQLVAPDWLSSDSALRSSSTASSRSDCPTFVAYCCAEWLRPFSQGLRLGHRGALPKLRPVNNTSPLRVGFDTFLFFAGLALGLRIS